MSFDLEKAMDDGGRCIAVDCSGGMPSEYEARIVYENMKGQYYCILVLVDYEGTEISHSFDHNGIDEKETIHLRNISRKFEVFNIIYQHWRDNSIQHSTKMSKTACEGTVNDLRKMNHKVLAVASVTLSEGEGVKNYEPDHPMLTQVHSGFPSASLVDHIIHGEE